MQYFRSLKFPIQIPVHCTNWKNSKNGKQQNTGTNNAHFHVYVMIIPVFPTTDCLLFPRKTMQFSQYSYIYYVHCYFYYVYTCFYYVNIEQRLSSLCCKTIADAIYEANLLQSYLQAYSFYPKSYTFSLQKLTYQSYLLRFTNCNQKY